MEEAFTGASFLEYGVMTIQDLYCMALDINLIIKRGVNPDAKFFITLDQDDVLNFKRIMKHMVATKVSTYVVELTNLTNNMQPKTIALKNFFTAIEEELDQKSSANGIFLLDKTSAHPRHLSMMEMWTKTRPY